MIYDDFIRQIFFAVIGGILLVFAGWAALGPHSLANILGYQINTPNAYSEFHAIYVGVFIAQALLCALAFARVQDAMIGDLVAAFLLSQPFGRFIAVIKHGFPRGVLLVLFIMELVGGTLLLVVRPGA